MKLIIALAALIVVINAASDQELWADFKKTHARTYKSLREEKLRFNIFQDTLRQIAEHNVKYENGESTYYLAINKFSDITDEEFRDMLMKNEASRPNLEGLEVADLTVGAAPESIDWRSKGVVLPVRNQGECGSCWALSTAAAIESQSAIKSGSKVPLSPQQLVDCSTSYGNHGCNGGFAVNGFEYVKDNGLESDADYPYSGKEDKCKANDKSRSVVELTGYKKVTASETSLKEAVGTIGPISAVVFGKPMKSYGGGIFDDSSCLGDNLHHGVNVVGYGIENGQKYWIIKNTWGADWGESGYIRLIRDTDHSCGVEKMASYPILA
uniref:Cathepsin L-like proteinase n=1 Tax=Phaedon cochleariae TaxID=80249 RepID=CATLL_PHACE|nr:RecName: Full=Cathepsin L-like proteinase; Flags: Precursor [Phaedon cochleariae]CAA76927.1 thiol protease [Phaedon cochleariae]